MNWLDTILQGILLGGLYALFAAGLSLEQLLGAGMSLFGPAFNPLVAQKTLSYFEGGDLDGLPAATKQLLVNHAARELDPRALPKLVGDVDAWHAAVTEVIAASLPASISAPVALVLVATVTTTAEVAVPLEGTGAWAAPPMRGITT